MVAHSPLPPMPPRSKKVICDDVESSATVPEVVWLQCRCAARADCSILVVAILGLMVLPIPPWMLDTFFTLNIAVALMVMMVAAS